jgi:hypothetical protein
MSPIDKKLAEALKGAPMLVTATVALMEELVRVLMREVEVVSKRKLTEHPELLKYKQRLAMDYGSNMKAIAAQSEMMKKLTPAAKDALRSMAKKLADAVDYNARMLRAAIDASRQLIQNVMTMIRNEALPRQSYKNTARAHLELGNYSPTCQPLTVSRTV